MKLITKYKCEICDKVFENQSDCRKHEDLCQDEQRLALMIHSHFQDHHWSALNIVQSYLDNSTYDLFCSLCRKLGSLSDCRNASDRALNRLYEYLFKEGGDIEDFIKEEKVEKKNSGTTFPNWWYTTIKVNT